MYLNVYNVHVYIIYVYNVYIDVYNVHIYRKFYPFPDEWIYGGDKFFRDLAVFYSSVCPST